MDVEFGSRTAKRCLAMEMNVLCYDPYKPAKDFPDGVEVVRDLDRIFTESDYISLHAPNTSVTHKMINKEKLAMMKSSAFLINTARGGLVNEDDLLEACKNGVIAGAGLDVIAHEPMLPNNPLYKLNNILITPHIVEILLKLQFVLLTWLLWALPRFMRVRFQHGQYH